MSVAVAGAVMGSDRASRSRQSWRHTEHWDQRQVACHINDIRAAAVTVTSRFGREREERETRSLK